MLCGVGGGTVAEAKANLSCQEEHDWFLFAEQRGGLNQIEKLLAIICTQINRQNGGDAEIGDFLPMMKTTKPIQENEASIGDVMNLLSMVV